MFMFIGAIVDHVWIARRFDAADQMTMTTTRIRMKKKDPIPPPPDDE
jgi:hypothetical protein